MKNNYSDAQGRLILYTVISVVVISFASYFLLLQPKWQQYQSDKTSAQEQEAKNSSLSQTLSGLQEQAEGLEEQLRISKDFSGYFPNKSEQSSLINALKSAAQSSSLDVESVQFKVPQKGAQISAGVNASGPDFPVGVVDISLRLTGATEKDLIEFLSLIEKEKMWYSVNEVTKTGEVTIMSVTSYLSKDLDTFS